MKNKLKPSLIIILLMLFFVAGCSTAFAGDINGTERITIDCYYLNTCSSCNPMIDFYDYFADVLGVDLASEGLNVTGHNLYENDELIEWKRLAEEKNYDENAYPAFMIDGIIYPLDYNQQSTNGIGDILLSNNLVFEPNTSKIIFFSAPGCENCEEVRELILYKLPDEVMLDNDDISEIKIIEYSIADIDDVFLFKEYCARYNIDEDTQETPLIFIGRSYYTHKTADVDIIISLLEYRNGLDTPIITNDQIRITDYVITDVSENSTDMASDGVGQDAHEDKKIVEIKPYEFEKLSFLGVIGVGLVNGLNPCAISMFLMLLSLVTMESRKIWKIGLSFAFGKFLGFFLLGTILYSFIDTINFGWIRLITAIILIAFSIAMIIINIMDFFAAKNERYGDIILQLPQSLRKTNHNIMKKFAVNGIGIFAGIGMGMLFSGGEFLCTGQIYLATIAGAIHSGTDFSTAIIYLLVYSLAFVLPLILLIFLAASGKRVFQMSEFFRRKMPMIKLLNAIIFVLIIALVLVFLI